MTDKNLITDMDQLLDGTLDDLADAPEFAPFPAGVHRATISFEVKKIDDARQGVELKIKAIETVEAENPDKVVSSGQSDNVFFFLRHPKPEVATRNQGSFKEIMAALQEGFGPKKNSELMELANGAEVLIATSLREEKKDGVKTGRQFLQLKSLTLV